MTARSCKELLCGLGSGFFGLLLLLLTYLQPYDESGSTSTPATGTVHFESYIHPGFTPIETPYIVAIGVPILGVVIGASLHSLTRSAAARPVRWISAGARILLWIATAILTLEASYGLIVLIGLVLAPSAALGICASLLARDAQSGARQPGTRHALI